MMNSKKGHMQYQLRISGRHFEEVKNHLFPGDGKEAIAIALCGRFINERVTMLLVHKILLIPYEDCIREPDFLEWQTERVVPFLTAAMAKNLAIVKIHSHPGWYDSFSSLDNKSDTEFFSSVYGWVEGDLPHASAVMLPDGSLFGRVILPDLGFKPISKVSVAGDQILIWPKNTASKVDDFGKRTAQLLGEGTYMELKRLKVGVVGCSGTGSIVIEQLFRNSVGCLVFVDGDPVEEKNVNRILNSKIKHAKSKTLKVEVLKTAVEDSGLLTTVVIFGSNLYDSSQAVKELATCDVLFGCMDTAEGRDLLNKLSSFYLIPYIDMGLAIESDGKGGIDKIEGSVHYIQPGKSSLLTRGVYTLDDVQAEYLLRKNKVEYDRLVEEGRKTGYKYIKDLNVERPAVISFNMQIASAAVTELLNRVHPFKISKLNESAKLAIDITDNFIVPEKESDFATDQYLLEKMGRGDMNPLLETVDLS
jgi:molybdopterin/thiamine biosynthesis adenylyltransferase